ncbi:MAG TPA: hypothetical protein PKU97_11730, partial [Kofleriaceae bacterium]|nr:hypothetical protein [Kofleriaceae bacterium]
MRHEASAARRAASWLALALVAGSAHSSRPAAAAPQAPGAASTASQGWTLEVPARLELALAAVGSIKVVLRGGPRHKVASSGVLVELAVPARGLGIRQRRYQRADAVDPSVESPELAFAIAVRAEALGSYVLQVHVRVWVC